MNPDLSDAHKFPSTASKRSNTSVHYMKLELIYWSVIISIFVVVILGHMVQVIY